MVPPTARRPGSVECARPGRQKGRNPCRRRVSRDPRPGHRSPAPCRISCPDSPDGCSCAGGSVCARSASTGSPVRSPRWRAVPARRSARRPRVPGTSRRARRRPASPGRRRVSRARTIQAAGPVARASASVSACSSSRVLGVPTASATARTVAGSSRSRRVAVSTQQQVVADQRASVVDVGAVEADAGGDVAGDDLAGHASGRRASPCRCRAAARRRAAGRGGRPGG